MNWYPELTRWVLGSFFLSLVLALAGYTAFVVLLSRWIMGCR